MYYATSLGRKRIIHTLDCPHCKRIREENLIEIPSIWAAFSKRYHLCKHCNPLMQKYKSEESAIQEYCSHNGLCFSIENKCFRVETPRSLWKITLEDNGTCTTLYHKMNCIWRRDVMIEYLVIIVRAYAIQLCLGIWNI